MRSLILVSALSLSFVACKGDPTVVTDTPTPTAVDTDLPTDTGELPPVDTGDVLTCGVPDGDLGSVVGTAVMTGDTCGAGNDFPASCTQYNGLPPSRGEDLAYTFTAGATGDFTFDTIGSANNDTALTIRTTCPENAELACNDDIAADNFLSIATVSLTEGESVVVVIDGYQDDICGGFVLNIDGPGGVVTPDPIVVSPTVATTAPIGDVVPYTITGLDDTLFYRVTLVHADNLTADGVGGGVFVNGGTGTAAAGPSENVALITSYNGTALSPGVKTFPAGTDDPAAPTGIAPVNGEITVMLTGVGAGTIFPVAYVNGGTSTFLELDSVTLMPTENYAVGGALEITDDLAMAPQADGSIEIGATIDYTITGLTNSRFYRVTLVDGANITADGAGNATFVDSGTGTAAAGASENVALITNYNTTALSPGVKTFPAGTDDPAAPTGIAPVNGQITVTITGVAAGQIYPVAYRNGGASTFLELDTTTLAPVEDYTVGGAVTVLGPI